MSEPVIRMENIVKTYYLGKPNELEILHGINLTVNKGEFVSIVGESGSGKSVTSKAILGILAGNAIVEGGQILYDGQDLLKIGEDDFYRLRGDKIAMIFQDPLSSLNPIMRIGKQLTEAMLLKGKARQRSSKENFHGKLNMLEKFMTQAPGADAAAVKEKCDQFRKFELKHIELEQGYNTAAEAAREALEETDNILFLIEKNAFKDDCAAQLRQVKEFALHAENPYVVSERAEELKTAAAEGTNVAEELGDLLFSAVNAARFLKVDPEDALNGATDKFIGRFRKVEAQAAAQGKAMEDMGLEELDALWERAKET